MDASTLFRGKVAGTILVVDTIPNLYSGLLPSLFTISSPFFHDQGAKAGNVKRIRQGEAIATALALGIGWAASVLFSTPNDTPTSRWLPLIGTLVMVGILLASYEYALANPASDEPSAVGSY